MLVATARGLTLSTLWMGRRIDDLVVAVVVAIVASYAVAMCNKVCNAGSNQGSRVSGIN